MPFGEAERADFIMRALRAAPVPGRADLTLYQAHERSDLAQLGQVTGRVQPYPYWAHLWPGGIGLAMHLGRHPEAVAGRRVLDLGAGSGLVAIAAARAGAAEAVASDVDPFAETAIWLNAGLNGVLVESVGDLLGGPATDADVILVGDVFYDARLGRRVLAFLRRAQLAGAEVLIGDIGRPDLPAAGLETLARFAAPEIGDSPGAPLREAQVHRLR